MSHIVTEQLKTVIKSESGIKSAIALMGTEFPGLTYEQKNPDLIQIRYKAIEVYQSKGNMRLVKNGSSWDLQLDRWNCKEIAEKVKISFERNYRKAGALAYAKKAGFRIQSDQTTESGSRLIAVRY